MKRNNFDFSNINFKPFFVALIAVLLMNLIHASGITKNFRLFSPLSQSTLMEQDFFETVRPLLERFSDNYTLHKKTSLVVQTSASEESEYDNARSYVVVDYDSGEILAEKESDKVVSIASLTKVMTAIVTLDLATSDEYFTVTRNASRQIPSKIYVKTGEHIQVRELLEAALLTSANDATQALADGVDAKYGEEIFIKAMNAKAEYLGLSNTHFTNPQGFDNPEHHSSARDMALLTHYALTYYPEIQDIVQKDFSYIHENDDHDLYKLPNWNGLIGVYPNVSGVKIGNTGRAKKTTIILSEREGKKILVVVLGAPGLFERDIWAAQLLNLGFQQTLGLPPIEVTREMLQEKYDSWYERLREE
jgi:D-alanyl-D-alanine carboxypeptidase